MEARLTDYRAHYPFATSRSPAGADQPGEVALAFEPYHQWSPHSPNLPAPHLAVSRSQTSRPDSQAAGIAGSPPSSRFLSWARQRRPLSILDNGIRWERFHNPWRWRT